MQHVLDLELKMSMPLKTKITENGTEAGFYPCLHASFMPKIKKHENVMPIKMA